MLYTGLITTPTGKAAYKIASDSTTYLIDWSDGFPTDQQLDTSIWVAGAGITVVSSAISGIIASAVLSGGVSGINYTITNTVTVGTVSRVRSFTLRVTDQNTYEASISLQMLYDRISLRKFETQCAAEVKGCPLSIVRQKIIEAARDFCTLSRTWRADVTCGNMIADQLDYRMEIPDDATVLVIQSAVRADVTVYAADGVYSKDWKHLSLLTAPSDAEVGEALTANVSLKLSESATMLPAIFNNFVSEIAAGAAALIQFGPNETWSNPQRAAHNQSIFEAAAMEADVEDLMGRAKGSLQAQPKKLGFTQTPKITSPFFW